MNAQPEKITYNNASKSPCSIVARMVKLIWSQIIPIFKMPLLPNMILAATLQFGIQSGYTLNNLLTKFKYLSLLF